MTRTTTETDSNGQPRRLYMALDISATSWAVGFCDGGPKVRVRSVVRKDCGQARDGLMTEVALARQAFGLSAQAPVLACYEAGRDGFWLARFLEQGGISCLVFDPSSIEVDRRAKQAKTDPIDAAKLVRLLVRHAQGDSHVRIVAQPSPEDEDARELGRTLERLQKNRRRYETVIQSLLFKHGIDRPWAASVQDELDDLRTGDGRPLGDGLKLEIRLYGQNIALLEAQIDELEQWRLARIAQPETPVQAVAHDLNTLNGVGSIGAWTLAHELLGTRKFAGPRQVGGFLGLAPMPWASGKMSRCQGISKSGPGRLRALLVQMAWGWLRFQPGSAIVKWYTERFGEASKRSRRVGIIALARKLAVALWRFTEYGEIPEGAVLKNPTRRAKPRKRTGNGTARIPQAVAHAA